MRVHVNIPQLAESAFRMRQCEEALQSTKQKMMEAVNAVPKTDLPEYQEFHKMTQTSGCEKFEAMAQDCEIWAQAFMDIHDTFYYYQIESFAMAIRAVESMQ